MSYTPYTPPAGGHPPTSTTYPYGAYHPTTYTQTPGAFPYQTPTYQTGVTSYGWPYTYGYIQHPQAVMQRPASLVTPAPVTAQNNTSTPATTTSATAPVTQRSSTTFTTYTPSYMRDNTTNAMAGSFSTRGSRKQSNLKGLFTKECELIKVEACVSLPSAPFLTEVLVVKSLMYGFGDDRNPSNDTVNVMEEILIEYITDVVCRLLYHVDF